jgi:nucleoid-associated protein YgaU
MKQTRIGISTTVILLIVIAILSAAGCDCPKRVRILQEQNEMLSAQVADLENQLAQADARAADAVSQPIPQQQIQSQPQTPPQAESVYVVVKGDTLWGIAQKQLGKGSRYEEILALNPQIQKNQPLTIGMTLKLPAR